MAGDVEAATVKGNLRELYNTARKVADTYKLSKRAGEKLYSKSSHQH